MGSIVFNAGELADGLAEQVGYKAGLALSLKELCRHLGEDYGTTVRDSEKDMVRLRAEDYEQMFYRLLHRVGYTDEEYDGIISYQGIVRDFKEHEDTVQGVLRIHNQMWLGFLEEAGKRTSKRVDPRPYLEAVFKEYGAVGTQIAAKHLLAISRAVELSPYSVHRRVEWRNMEQLSNLFGGSRKPAVHGRYIDQRFVDYLSQNHDQLGGIHWRKFEQLTAEFFDQAGFLVELGPGTGDDGVDVRVWEPGQDEAAAPMCIIQCKRQREKVQKIVVKGLYADVLHENAEYGLVVTTSDLSPGARKTVVARGYPIDVINNAMLRQWLKALRTPGSGIVRC